MKGFPWDDLRNIFVGCQWMASIPKTAENFNWLSRMHERYRQTTDRRTGDSIANSRSRSLKINKAYSVVGIIRPHCNTTYVDGVYCYRPSSVVCRSVCRSVTLVSPAKTAEPIEMPFRLRTRVGQENHVIDGYPDAPWEGAIFGGETGVPLYRI